MLSPIPPSIRRAVHYQGICSEGGAFDPLIYIVACEVQSQSPTFNMITIFSPSIGDLVTD